MKIVLLVVGTAALLVGFTRWENPETDLPMLAAISLAVCLPLALRKRLPLTAAILASGISLLGSVIPGWPGRLVAMAALCCAAYYRPLRLSSVVAVSLVWVIGYGILSSKMGPAADLIVLGVALPVVGYALRLQRDRAGQTVRLRLAEADRVAAEDRARLAREVHDSVGHHLTAIRLQAMAARRALGGTPELADRVLGTIDDLSSSALSEVRALLTTSRGDTGLAEVGGLVRRLSTVDRRITVRGTAAPLSPVVDHAAYRVVQEALTNAVRHTDATEIDVCLRHDRHAIEVTVTDNGTGVAQVVEGHGIRGMRERVHVLGGTLSVGPRPRHGWSVRATIPA
ncbi:sensor histidine kinase [Amycolatopsis alba]|uniref:histidine kinase n=1 Tax=Amycolatopsis alba DSM 44262 TaxID=1125972 RepID=A0A229R9W5_AMYAL|nr:sensor histidine kinase [Amycolatopsis alba]OXM43462.1 two-component sensor histidine kinase [Amycolatopsis alba DSM 44262]